MKGKMYMFMILKISLKMIFYKSHASVKMQEYYVLQSTSDYSDGQPTELCLHLKPQTALCYLSHQGAVFLWPLCK